MKSGYTREILLCPASQSTGFHFGKLPTVTAKSKKHQSDINHMKRSTIIFYVLLLLTVSLKGQNPLPALKDYQYDTDNNIIDFDKEIQNPFDQLTFTNVYYRYYKNPQYNQTFSSIKIMLFRVEYEFLLQTHITNNNEMIYKFQYNKKEDKIIRIKVTNYCQENGKTIATKLSKKDYEVIIADSVITIKPNKGALKLNTTLRIYCSIESSDINLKNLSPLNKIENSSNYISFNVPEIFKYMTVNNSLEIVRTEQSDMKLIKFTYDVNKLTENYYVLNSTVIWKISNDFDYSGIYFPLLSINIPDGVGISAQEIINKGKS
jgi:hypothetical protein